MQSASEILDYYAYLGVPDTADPDEIKQAYRKCLLEHHPDRNPGSIAVATKTTQLITTIYQTLSDSTARATYDVQLKISRLKKQSEVRADALKTTPLLAAALGEDAQAVWAAISVNFTPKYILTTIECTVNNRKLMLNAIEIVIIKKRYDMFLFLISSYDIYPEDYLQSDPCRVFEFAAEYYQPQIFDYLRKKGMAKQGAITQICRSSLTEPAVVGVLVYSASSLMDLKTLDALFNANMTAEKVRGLQTLIANMGATTFVSNLFNAFRNLKFSETQERKIPNDLYLSHLKALNINLNNWPTRGYIFSLVHSLPDSANFTAILNGLISFACYPQTKDFLVAANHNHSALLSYLVHDSCSKQPMLTNEDLMEIFIALVRSKKRSTKFTDILQALHSRFPGVLFTVDEADNNCLHLNIMYGNQESITRLTEFLMSKITVEQGAALYYGKNSSGQMPKNYSKNQQFAAFLTWLNTPKSAASSFFSPVASKNPHAAFLGWLKPFIDCIQGDDFLIFTDLIKKLSLEQLHDPAIGFCLLQKSILGGRLQFIDLLVKSGCDIYLKYDNPLHRILYTWVNNAEVEQYLLRAEEEINKVILEKRAIDAAPKDESKRPKNK
jgi:hypothetical protein